MSCRGIGVFCAVWALAAVAGCGTLRESYPARTATEQLLISAAADRAICELPVASFKDKKVFVDAANLETQTEKLYVIQRLAARVAEGGGLMMADAKDADILLKAASGALSIDRRDFLFGIPSIPIPVLGVGTVQTPELAIFKIVSQRGKAKLLFQALDAKTGREMVGAPTCYGHAYTNFWNLLFTGPWKSSDVPECNEETAK